MTPVISSLGQAVTSDVGGGGGVGGAVGGEGDRARGGWGGVVVGRGKE